MADGRWRQAVVICHLLSAICCLIACTDPRARPAPPIVRISVAPSFVLNTPGTILGSLYAFDEDGLDVLEISVRNTAGNFAADSVIVLPGDAEVTRPIVWNVPPGLLIGSQVTLAVRVRDFTGFATSDSLRLTVQDTISAGR